LLGEIIHALPLFNGDAAMAPAAGTSRRSSFSNSGNPERQQREVRLKRLYTGSFFAGSQATVGTNLRHAMIALEPKFFGNQICPLPLSRRCVPNNAKGRSRMSNPNQNPGQQNQNPGQKPGQQQGGGQKPGQQQQDPNRQGQGQQGQKDR
jgi:hypothetical protein